MTPQTTTNRPDDAAALAVGSGILLTQAFALFPGLLPCLLLLLPLVLPVVALGLVAAVLVGLPLSAWRLTAWTARRLTGSQRPGAARGQIGEEDVLRV